MPRVNSISCYLSYFERQVSAMNANPQRIARDIEALRRMSAPGKPGVHRMSFSPEYRAAADYLAGQMSAAGLSVREDGLGVLYGTLPGSDPGAAPILSGSHLDTVPSGGAFDGAAGIVAALEAARMIAQSGTPLRHPLEVVAFIEEEGTLFGHATLASSLMAGTLDDRALDSFEQGGRSLRQMARDYGASGLIEDISRQGDRLHGFVELHIEQGPVLEGAGCPIGVVDTIVGLQMLAVRVTGQAGHAGTTPMPGRRDAGIGAFKLILAVNEHVCSRWPGEAVVTVGRMSLEPGGNNVIPSAAAFNFDLRSQREDVIADVRAFIEAKAGELAERMALGITVTPGRVQPPRPMDGGIKAMIAQSAANRGLGHMNLPSGAGHDAMLMAALCRTAMIFVPSDGGLSHNPAENTSAQALADGTNVLYDTLRALDAAE